MRNSLEALDVVWKSINTYYSNYVSGGIYKLTRPFDSKLEDVIVNALPITSSDVQRCVVNVNCYVQDITVNINGKSTDMANTKRLKEIAEDVVDLLNEEADDGYYFHLQNQTVLKADESQHYINLRIEVIFLNEN